MAEALGRTWKTHPLSDGPGAGTLQWPSVHAAGSGSDDGVLPSHYDAPHKDALEPLYDVLAVLEQQCYAAAPPAVLAALKRQVATTADRWGKKAADDKRVAELKTLCVRRKGNLLAPAATLPRLLGIIAADAAKRSDLPSGTVM